MKAEEVLDELEAVQEYFDGEDRMESKIAVNMPESSAMRVQIEAKVATMKMYSRALARVISFIKERETTDQTEPDRNEGEENADN